MTSTISQIGTISQLATSLSFRSGASMPNRFMLAPLTNMQSQPDGSLSDVEYRWLTMRAAGGFGATMTCAAAVQQDGTGWPGELATYAPQHRAGLAKLAKGLRANKSLSLVQLFHGGLRADPEVSGLGRVSASDHAKSGARALTETEIEKVISAFVDSAITCEKAGFDGVELHGAHGYLIAQFLSPRYNQRNDHYGGSLQNRARFLTTIIDRIRAACSPGFIVGLRLSAERFGLEMNEMLALSEQLMGAQQLDFLDVSLWDCFKAPEDSGFQSRPLIDWYSRLPRAGTRLGVAGALRTPADVNRAIEAGADFVLLGRAAILNHDFPMRMIHDPAFMPRPLPVTRADLEAEGLGDVFIDYLAQNWEGFVA